VRDNVIKYVFSAIISYRTFEKKMETQDSDI